MSTSSTAHDVEVNEQAGYWALVSGNKDFRRLWITRINAAARMRGSNYSQFIHGKKEADIELNRKMLAELAVNDVPAFDRVFELAEEELND